MRESFVLYTAFYNALKFLSDEQLGRVFRAIFEYQISEKEDVDDDIRIAFLFVKNQLDIDRKKYEDTSSKRKNAINKRWEKTLLEQDTNVCFVDTKNTNERFVLQEDTKNTNVCFVLHNDNENDNENEYVNDNENEREYTHARDNITQKRAGRAETETQFAKVPPSGTDGASVSSVYGRYNNVRLSNPELLQLKEAFPNDYQVKIDNLSAYMETTGKVYRNHYAVLIKWASEDERKTKNDGSSGKKYSFTDMDNHSYSNDDFENMFDDFTGGTEEKKNDKRTSNGNS